MNKASIFLAQPTYDFKIDARISNVITAELGRTIKVVDPRSFSLIPYNFNLSWCECLNRRAEFEVDYFMMLHADVKPEPGFAGKMLAEMRRSGAHVLSAVVPFKNNSGLTSTALDFNVMDIPLELPRRLTMREVAKLPETFSLADCREIDARAIHLLVNTGLMLVDLNFVHALGKDRKLLCFAEYDWLVEDQDGKLAPRVLSEDWYFSRMAASMGGKVMATRKIHLTHLGPAEYPNYGEWGRESDVV